MSKGCLGEEVLAGETGTASHGNARLAPPRQTSLEEVASSVSSGDPHGRWRLQRPSKAIPDFSSPREICL